jgi:hypothetical protein
LPFAALMLAATPSLHSSGANLAVAGFVVRALSDQFEQSLQQLSVRNFTKP